MRASNVVLVVIAVIGLLAASGYGVQQYVDQEASAAYDDGYDTGRRRGYDAGKQEGYDEGHDDGYREALNEDDKYGSGLARGYMQGMQAVAQCVHNDFPDDLAAQAVMNCAATLAVRSGGNATMNTYWRMWDLPGELVPPSQ